MDQHTWQCTFLEYRAEYVKIIRIMEMKKTFQSQRERECAPELVAHPPHRDLHYGHCACRRRVYNRDVVP